MDKHPVWLYRYTKPIEMRRYISKIVTYVSP